MKKITPLTAHDGEELVQLLNEVTELAHRTVGVNDLYLHYRDGDGWR